MIKNKKTLWGVAAVLLVCGGCASTSDGTSVNVVDDIRLMSMSTEGLSPAEARRAGLDDGLAARLEESAGEQMLEKAKWYIRRHDDVSARYVIDRLLAQYPDTIAASRGLRLLGERGWIEQGEPAGEGETEQGDQVEESAS